MTSDTATWHSVGKVTPRYELRSSTDVLTVVSYSRSDGMWSTARTGGFIRFLDAKRWEEMRLKLPDCPIVEVQQ